MADELYKQAPALKALGEEFILGRYNDITNPNGERFETIAPSLRRAVMQTLDGKNGAMLKIMWVLLGTLKDGSFKVSQKWIMNETGISSTQVYYKARKGLENLGWLIVEDGYIYLDCDAIRAATSDNSQEKTKKDKKESAIVKRNDTITDELIDDVAAEDITICIATNADSMSHLQNKVPNLKLTQPLELQLSKEVIESSSKFDTEFQNVIESSSKCGAEFQNVIESSSDITITNKIINNTNNLTNNINGEKSGLSEAKQLLSYGELNKILSKSNITLEDATWIITNDYRFKIENDLLVLPSSGQTWPINAAP